MRIHVDVEYWRSAACRGDEPTVREAAAVSEPAYFRFLARLDEATIEREIRRMDDLERRLA